MFTNIKFKTLNITNKTNITNILTKNFSIFQKIRKLTKSKDYKNTTESISGTKHPDDIEVEYDRPKNEKESKKNKSKTKNGLTAEELLVLKNLPKETVSKK